jgi:predicted nucleic acid-binding protein
MAINDELLNELMNAVRVKSGVGKEEISGLAEACKKDLEIAGVYVTDETDPLYRQAQKLYSKANYGYDKDSEKFRAAYAALKDAMALSGDYMKAGESDG